MTVKEFQIWVQEETDFSVLDVVDYDANIGGYMIDVESIFDIAKAYHQSRVNAISDEEIVDALSEHIINNDSKKILCEYYSQLAINAVKNKLLKQ